MIRVLLVDDSPTILAILTRILSKEPEIEIVGTASDGRKALEMVRSLAPDIVTMDVELPKMNGVEATRAIMAECPVPVLILSSRVDSVESVHGMDALAAGAVGVHPKPTLATGQAGAHPKPSSATDAGLQPYRASLVRTLKTYAGLKMVHRTRRRDAVRKHDPSAGSAPTELIAIGCSTGGPPALTTLLSGLPGDFAIPIAVVLHMSEGFIGTLTEWLGERTPLTVKLAGQGEKLVGGTVYFAPDGRHFTVDRVNGGINAVLVNGGPVDGFMPSATMLLESAGTKCGPQAVGVLLTGMGTDGVKGMIRIKEAGGRTIVQSGNTCVVNGMPKAAVNAGVVDEIIDLDNLAPRFARLS